MSAHVGPCKNFFRSFACLVARFVIRLRATLGDGRFLSCQVVGGKRFVEIFNLLLVNEI